MSLLNHTRPVKAKDIKKVSKIDHFDSKSSVLRKYFNGNNMMYPVQRKRLQATDIIPETRRETHGAEDASGIIIPCSKITSIRNRAQSSPLHVQPRIFFG